MTCGPLGRRHLDHLHAATTRAAACRGEQGRLAHTRISDDDDATTAALPGRVQQAVELSQLSATTHEHT
jgi:hypothetical protein